MTRPSAKYQAGSVLLWLMSAKGATVPNAGRRKAYQKSSWKRGDQRKRVYSRDGYRCRSCGRPGKQIGGQVTLSLQHLVPERVLTAQGREPADHELVTLCLSCHGRQDGGRRYNNGGLPI